MANMIKFYRGLVNSLPTTGENGALYITTDEGAIYYGTGTGMKRLGDFIQVANVASLPEKAHESCLYYCVAENILAKWNGTEWKQINKQPTAEEMKTLLGLGSMAYKSEVAEGDLNADLKAKVNAAAEGNHSHDNKALLDTYTQTEADLADAVAKKHAHANAEELAKFVDGDKAKYDAVVADHLTSADKTALESSIKEAKKAGTDANTALETYKVTNDARVLAVEEDMAEITDAESGILAQAKGYADGKDGAIAEAKKAGTDASAALEAYKTSNDSALAGVKATAEAAAVKTEVESALAGKVDKVEGKSLIADSEIARLATLANYDDTQVKADIAKKADAEAMTTELGKKVDKVTGYSLVSDTEIARLAEVDNYDDAEVRGLIGDNADAIAEIAGDYVKAADIADFETKANVKKVADDLAAYVESNDAAVADRYTKSEADEKFALKGADAYDDTEVRGFISDNADAIAAEAERAAGIEAGLRTDVDAIKGDYLKAADKTELQGNIDTLTGVVETLRDGIDAEKIDGLKDLIDWADEHAPEVDGIKKDIEANAKAIEDEAARADAAEKVLAGRLDTLEAIDHDAYKAADTALHTVISKEIDDDVAAAISAEVIRADGAYDAKGAAATAKSEAIADAATKYETIGTAQGIVDGLKLAETYEPIGAETRAIAAAEGKVNALAGNVYTKAEVYTKTEVENLMTWGEF